MEEIDCPQPPPSYFCPISLSIFVDPVTLGFSGQTFERFEIEYWLRHNNTNPLTNELLMSLDRNLTPNLSLYQDIDQYFQSIEGMTLMTQNLTVGEKLGSGSQKSVFLTNYGNNTVVVLKFHQVNFKKGGFGVMLRLGFHRHLIKSFGRTCLDQNNDVVSGGYNSILTEFAPLGNLSLYFANIADRSENLTLRHMLLIAEQVADGMLAVHAAGIIHRDLKARNIMIFAMDVNYPECTFVKVGDYGLQLFTGEQSSESSADKAGPSLRWASPEAMLSLQCSKESDVWAFGVLCWEILTQGGFPYGYLEDSEVASRVAVDGLRLLKPVDCPLNVWQLISRCWSDNPDDRPSFLELKHTLRELQAKHSRTYLPLSNSMNLAPPPAVLESPFPSRSSWDVTSSSPSVLLCPPVNNPMRAAG